MHFFLKFRWRMGDGSGKIGRSTSATVSSCAGTVTRVSSKEQRGERVKTSRNTTVHVVLMAMDLSVRQNDFLCTMSCDKTPRRAHSPQTNTVRVRLSPRKEVDYSHKTKTARVPSVCRREKGYGACTGCRICAVF